jgi:hypothetical protein
MVKNITYCLCRTFALAAGCAVLLSTLSNAHTFYQSNLRVRDQSPDQAKRSLAKRDLPNEPVKILDVKLKGKSAQLNSEMAGDEDWLKGFYLKVKNTSPQTIVYLSFHLRFREDSSSQSLLTHQFSYGRPPVPGAPEEPKLLLPGDTAELTLSDRVYDSLRRSIEKRVPSASIRAADIELSMVIFEDDSAWVSGVWMRRDPNNPRKWKPIQ